MEHKIINFRQTNKNYIKKRGLLMSKLLIMEWNINGRSGNSGAYSIPPFIKDEIKQRKVDIIVLTEFGITAGWHHFKSSLEKSMFYIHRLIYRDKIVL